MKNFKLIPIFFFCIFFFNFNGVMAEERKELILESNKIAYKETEEH